MTSWPGTWRQQALTAAGVPVTGSTLVIMKAWKDSTPLQPYTNNPIGMPAGSSGAPALLNTKYALFPTMQQFYSAFGTFMSTYQGRQIALDMTSDTPYPKTWRGISSLNWPASSTETDYPSALLDMTSEEYRKSVNATVTDSRKTSGEIAPRTESAALVIDNARSLAQAGQAIADVGKLTNHLLRKHGGNG
jgi:hypothetical protein